LNLLVNPVRVLNPVINPDRVPNPVRVGTLY